MKALTQFVQAACQSNGFKMIPAGVPVEMKIWCLLRRPDEDFVGRQRGIGRLRPEAMSLDNTLVAIKPDTDNLAKFILDGVTKVLYEDDSQIVDLHICKMRDNGGLCNGRVALQINRCTKTHQEMMPFF